MAASSCEVETAAQNISMESAESNDKGSKIEDEEPLSEGRHVTLLRNALDKSIGRCISAGRFSLFAKNHPTIAQKNARALKSIHDQYIKELKTAVQTEVDTMIEEEHLVHLLNELDDLISEAPDDLEKPAWRPSGSPTEDVRAHLIPIKMKQKARLEKVLDSLEDDNARLTKAVLPRRQRLANTQKSVRQRCAKLAKVTEYLQTDELQILKKTFTIH